MLRNMLAAAVGGMAVSVSVLAADSKTASYEAQFTAQKTELDHYWIMDHGKRVALFTCTSDGTAQKPSSSVAGASTSASVARAPSGSMIWSSPSRLRARHWSAIRTPSRNRKQQ
jgi:hypothetical protein